LSYTSVNPALTQVLGHDAEYRTWQEGIEKVNRKKIKKDK
jgi:hypothetical protein